MIENDRETFRVDARRRLVLLGGLNALLLSVIGFRLFYLQVMKGGVYRDLAENNRISMQPVPAPRGRIFDRLGEILVDNRPDYRLVVIPELSGGLKQLLTRLQPLLDLSEKDIQLVLKLATKQRAFLPLKVKSHLTWEEITRVEARIHTFPGTVIQIQSQRYYPYGSLSSHVVGYIGELSDGDKKAFTDIVFRSGDLVGKSGVERHFEPLLRGKEGVQEMEINALGRVVRSLRQTPPKPGKDIYLTLDMDLQREAEAAMNGKVGAVVVLNPRNGEVLAMANQPTYDPNQFVMGLSTQQWRKLASGPNQPLINKAVQGQYPPGSTFKMVVALAAMADGKISPHDLVTCTGSVVRLDHEYHCWRRGGHGTVNMVQALEQSCDVYFYKVAEKIGIDSIERMSRQMGLGELSGVGLDSERGGLIPSRAWKRTIFNQPWYPGETLVNAIGQGYILTTPLQLANMVACIGNGGYLYTPTLIRLEPGETAQPRRRLSVSPQNLQWVKTGMEEVINGKYGTAHQAAPKLVRAAGKTGTAQVARLRRKESGAIIPSTDPNLQDHALFVCYAPSVNPQLAIAVVIEHGGHGSSVAAPVASQIVDHYFSRPEPKSQLEPSHA